jgi:hypothetical protein
MEWLQSATATKQQQQQVVVLLLVEGCLRCGRRQASWQLVLSAALRWAGGYGSPLGVCMWQQLAQGCVGLAV